MLLIYVLGVISIMEVRGWSECLLTIQTLALVRKNGRISLGGIAVNHGVLGMLSRDGWIVF